MKQGKVKEKKNDNGGEDDQVATTTSDFFIVYDSDVVNFACQETSWVIDSGASIHATPRKDFFTSYTSGDSGSVRMGNDGSAKAIGMGDVRLETSNGTMLTLKNVKHIPDIRINLISTGKLDDEGFCNTFRDSQWKLTRGSMVIAKVNKSSSLYFMQARVIDSSINAVDDDSTFELWHNRLGHMSEKGLMILAKKNLLSGMKKGSLKRCAHCLAGKQTRVAFKTLHHTRKPEFDVPDRIWSNNEISYDHLRVFGCKAFVHIPKDERSKLDAKTRPCVFIGYGQDELGYRFYDPVQKKLVRSRDVVFMEDHTIQDIEKTNPMESQHSGDLIDLDPAPLTNLPTQVEDEAHDDQHDMGDVETPTQVEDEAHDDQHDMGDVETPTQVEVDDDVHEQSPAAEAPSDIPLRRSTRDRHPSTVFC
ncbi:hypothetical protein VitviT2T_026489 [Vitis vinifera]|uniref:Retrovirus-related Pol polyprotein from transposon TNT 1-94 n=1 Tax=Vitis vinifera TaxID=29760 RepID=A0ABY9DP06_VITVI|nr:hypothetical protein VitviT2T_026489 [Vitis vinifera]